MGRDDRPEFYRDQSAWQRLQECMPPESHIVPSDAPVESYWSWQGHRVHLDRYDRPNSPATVILHHGVGTNGRQMMLVLGKRLADRGIACVAPDNLGYGLTRVAARSAFTYSTWVELLSALVAEERERSGKPVILFGLSAGGMLAYHVAANTAVHGIIGMTFLDQRDQRTRDTTSRNVLMSRLVPLLPLASRCGLDGLRVPMRLVSKMTALTNDPKALQIMLHDKTSGGNAVTLRFLHSYMNYQPGVEPAQFDTCPVLLTQPADDTWSPRNLSEPTLGKLTKVRTETAILDGAGHYPTEEPGLSQLVEAAERFVTTLTAASTEDIPVSRTESSFSEGTTR